MVGVISVSLTIITLRDDYFFRSVDNKMLKTVGERMTRDPTLYSRLGRSGT